jgi:hypothetical protein
MSGAETEPEIGSESTEVFDVSQKGTGCEGEGGGEETRE